MTRIIVVTGAGRGIGRGIALRCLAEGHAVAALDQDRQALARLCEARDTRAMFPIECDISSPEQVQAAFDKIRSWGGRIDCLVNNAAIARPDNGLLESLDYEQWRRVLSVNLDGAFLCTRACVRDLRSARGAIVNLASTRALQSEPHTEAYAASKGGIVALTHALAVSLGPEVRVNAISPGWIDTREREPADLRPRDHAQHPVGRVGRIEDVAEMALFLLSERAAFITGQNIVVDGGMTRKMIYED